MIRQDSLLYILSLNSEQEMLLTVKSLKSKMKNQTEGTDKKHSGKYIIQAVSHHFFNDGKAYTKVKTIRSTTQQDEASSAKS